jgi:hypothetical protein
LVVLSLNAQLLRFGNDATHGPHQFGLNVYGNPNAHEVQNGTQNQKSQASGQQCSQKPLPRNSDFSEFARWSRNPNQLHYLSWIFFDMCKNLQEGLI